MPAEQSPAPPGPEDMTASQMLAAMRDCRDRKPKCPKEEGWFTAYELSHVDGQSMSHAKLHILLDAARDSGRLESQMDWRVRGDGNPRQVMVYRIHPKEYPHNAD